MENKVVHGQYIKITDKQHIGDENMYLWLSSGDLQVETEREIVAARDQALQTEYFATKILHT
jgi:hypothetical protein